MESKNLLGIGILGGCLVLSSLVFGLFFYEARTQDETVKVVGIAAHRYEADTVKWTVTLEETATPGNMKSGYRKLMSSREMLFRMLEARGLPASGINLNPVNTMPTYNRDGVISGYRIRQDVYLISQDLETVENLALYPEGLVEEGIQLQGSDLKYFYSKVDELKKELLSEATANARERAEQILENTEVGLGKLLSLRAGVFQITEPFSTEVSSYGVYNTASRKKEIKVTVHAVFAMR